MKHNIMLGISKGESYFEIFYSLFQDSFIKLYFKFVEPCYLNYNFERIITQLSRNNYWNCRILEITLEWDNLISIYHKSLNALLLKE